jgi:hypothetical protein
MTITNTNARDDRASVLRKAENNEARGKHTHTHTHTHESNPGKTRKNATLKNAGPTEITEAYFFFFFFSGAADEGLPRKRRKVRMKEKIETTSCGMIDAGILWTMTTYSAPWSVITSAPRSVP